MKNMKIGRKLALSFGIVAFVLLFVAVVGGVTAVNMNNRVHNVIEAARASDAQRVNEIERNAEHAQIRTLIILITATVLSFVAVVILATYLSKRIAKPLVVLNEFMKHASATGDISLSEQDYKDIEELGSTRDETGELHKFTGAYVMHINNMADELTAIANGDLTREAKLLSQDDTLGNALKHMSAILSSMFSEVKISSSQVTSGSEQIADGAQSLAQGSTEQSAAVEQLGAAITEIAKKTQENADMAEKAATLQGDIKNSAEKGSKQMDEMMSAVRGINASSQNISKVIKSIDDIAFQTNILALNAAVEAARAGQHGKGFAVVAEEVRSLAAKSAESAKDTEKLIADSIEKAGLGSRIAGDTAASLSEIVSGIAESSRLVVDIAKSSRTQTEGIEQINRGIDQIVQVTHQTSATAEQSASAAEEMNSQAQSLEGLLMRFNVKSGEGRGYVALPKH